MIVLLGILALAELSSAGAGARADGQADPLSRIAVTRAVAPPYPAAAIQSDAEGLVVVRVSIGGDGSVSRASIVTQTAPSDLFRPDEFEKIAKQWRFDVGESVDVDLVFAFQLVDESDDVGPQTTFEPPTTVTVKARRESSRSAEGN
jgi:outer membrane biosynthesis protein TonB